MHTVRMSPLNKRSARRRGRYLYNPQQAQEATEFQSVIPKINRLQIYP